MSALEIVQNDAPAPAMMQPQAAAIVTPMQMLAAAVDRGADIATIERLAALAERVEAQVARRAFNEAIAAFKAEAPTVLKGREIRHNGKLISKYEDIAAIAKAIDLVLARHGLSYRFRTEALEKAVRVSCIISHRAGHSEETSLTGPHDASGAKNAIQGIGSSVTYLQRYTLKAALGLAATEDDDGKASNQHEEERPRLSEDQLMELRDLIAAADTTEQAFCDHIKAERLADIYADNFQKACSILNQRIARRRA